MLGAAQRRARLPGDAARVQPVRRRPRSPAHRGRDGCVVQRRQLPAPSRSGISTGAGSMTDLLDAMTVGAAGMLAVAAAIFVVYSLDEIVLLCAYALWYVRHGRKSTRRPLSAALLRQEPERRLAIMLPAWDESNI